MSQQILDKLIENYHLSENDQLIATYMIEHLEDIPHLSSREFAKRTYTTATSIIRFVKKIGYKNYNDFKYHIVLMLKNMDLEDYDIFSGEDILSISHKISQLESEVIQQTKDSLNTDILNEIAKQINQKKFIDIYANDTNASISYYAAHILSRLGLFVHIYQDTDLQIHHALNINHDHLIMMISKHSKNPYLIDIAKTLSKRHISYILITGKDENILSQYASYVIHTPFDSQASQIQELSFYTSLKYVFDILYSLLYSMTYEKTKRYEQLYDQIFFKNL